MKKILLQLDSDRTASVFDAVTAYDAGTDVLLQYGGVEAAEVRALVYGAMFTRGPADLKSSAIFVGGTDVAAGEVMLKEGCGSFFGPLRTSVMLDAAGCNTTSPAAVVRIVSTVPVNGATVVVFAGTVETILTTAAVAVVLHPFASSITDVRRGPKKEPQTSLSMTSPLATSVPPTKIAEFFRSAGPRVNIAP